MRIVMESEQEVSSLFTIAGTFDYFPTVYEEERVVVVGNLEYLSTLVGVIAPHGIWLRLDEDVDGNTVLRELPRTGVVAGRQRDTKALISEAQSDLGRVGVFGTLSVGFVASAFMAAVGLLVYSYTSLSERVYRLSVLRAVGLAYGQIIGQVVLEYGVLTVYGAAVGAVIGAGASQFFAPFFTITGEKRVPLPPLIPVIAQGQVGVLAGAFAGMMVVISAIVITTTLSRRRFDLLRMGRG
jgi:putative ABC transport system permease protein